MNHIPRTAVKSTNIKSIGYDDESRTLVVEFTNGGLYSYEDVPPDVVEKRTVTESSGQWFLAHIRGRFKTTKGA